MSHPMPHLKQVVSVGKATVATEYAVEASIQHLCRLIDASFTARREADFHVNLVEPSVKHLRASLDNAFEMRANLLQAHNHMGAFAKTLGITEENSGVVWPCQPKKFSGARTAVVSQAA